MLFQFAPIIPAYLLVVSLLLFLAARSWALRSAPGAKAWSITMLFCAIYAIGSCLEIALTVPVWKLVMGRVIYLGTTGLVFFWGIFAIQYSNPGRLLNRFTVTLLAIIPVVTLCLALFAEHHQLLYNSYEFVHENGLIIGRVSEYGSWFWVWMGYSYLIFIGSWLLLLQSIIRFQAILRGQAWMVILASALPMLVYSIHMAGLNFFSRFDPTILSMAFSGVIMLLAMTQFKFMDIVPVAYDLIFKNVKSGIILIDLKERIVGMNQTAEQLLGCYERNVIGKPAIDIFPPQFHFSEKLWEAMEIKTEIAMSEAGSYYESQVNPLHNHRGDLVGHLMMLYDITERKQIENQSLELGIERERVHLLQRFISHMSHDLRTPLTSLKVTQYLLRKELTGEHTIRLDALAQQTERLTEMVESMLTLLRLEKDELGDLLGLDINELIGYVIERNQVLAGTSGAQLHFNPGKDLPQILANKEELTLALSNVVVNAIRYTPSGGEIKIHTLQNADRVIIHVQDNGIGISGDDLPHIFERFYRVDSARGTQRGGFGLGLTITKTILERHAGDIDVKSQLGEGSEFCVRIPIAKPSSI